ncbi:MAG: DUF2071 domain-containing protein [Actinomycetota bacterium]|nr:DUF2071 domain-containing protein [Actinomycetota bacterium]
MRGLPMVSIEVENFAVISYPVAAERIEAHLPSVYELDTMQTSIGRTGFVSTTCFCNHAFRLARIKYPRHTFNESTYRTYVNYKGRHGIYFFGRYLGTRLAWLAQRPLARDTFVGDFAVKSEIRNGAYDYMSCRVTSRHGDTSFLLEGDDGRDASLDSDLDLEQFLTYRLHGFFTAPLGLQGHMPVNHPRMRPFRGRLSDGRFDLWTELGILDDSEITSPASVLIAPRVPFTLYAPRPIV